MRRSDAFLRQPLAHHALGRAGIVAIGVSTELCAEAQEQLLGHGVVAVLVDVADHFDQVRREGSGQQAGALGHVLDPVTALDGATQFVPDCPNGAGGVGWVIEQRQVGLRVAAVAQLAADHHADPVGLGNRVVADVAGALLGGHGLDLVVDTDAGDRWLDGDGHLAAVIAGDEAQGLEVDQQGIGLDQERLVDVTAIVVELRQVGLHEVAAIEHQVAGDGAHAIGTQVTHQQPEFLHVQLRVATAFEVEVAVEHAIAEGTVGVELGLPLERGAEQFKGGIGGDQFHGRGGVDRHVCVEHGRRARAIEGQHNQRQCGVLQFVGLQRQLHLGWQGSVDGCRMAGQCERQHQAGKNEGAKLFDHMRLIPCGRGKKTLGL